MLSWSTVATAFKITLQHLTHFEMLLVASLTSLLIFAAFLTIQRKWRTAAVQLRANLRTFALLGLLNPVAYYLLLFKSYDLLPAHVAQPVNYLWPIALLILLAVFTRQAIPPLKYIGMALSLGGLALISATSTSSDGKPLSVPGLLLGLFSAILWATYWMANNRYKARFDAFVGFFATFLFGSLYLLAAAAVQYVLSGPQSFSPLTTTGLLAGAYVGAFEMGIPFIFFGLALRLTSNPALINQLCYLAPFLSLFIISSILHEHISPATYGGLLLIVLGLLFNQYIVRTPQTRETPAPQAP